MPYDWSILTIYVTSYIDHLALRTESQANMVGMWNITKPHILKFWQDKMVEMGRIVGGLGY